MRTPPAIRTRYLALDDTSRSAFLLRTDRYPEDVFIEMRIEGLSEPGAEKVFQRSLDVVAPAVSRKPVV